MGLNARMSLGSMALQSRLMPFEPDKEPSRWLRVEPVLPALEIQVTMARTVDLADLPVKRRRVGRVA